jgi:RNA polymerase primary sigma factor
VDDECAFLDDPLQVYLAHLKNVPPMDRAEEMACLRHLRAEDEWAEDARTRLVEVNLQLVVAIADRYCRDQPCILDLIQEGNCGLLRAAQSPPDGAAERFSTHATPFVERAIAEAISVSGHSPSPPHNR